MNKHVTLFDFQNTTDVMNSKKIWTRSEIIFKDIDTGKVLFTTHNKVLIAGSQFVAQKVFDLPKLNEFPSYNSDLQLENSVYTAPERTPKVCLFCCGTNGCGTESSNVFPVDYTKRINPSNGDLVPFRYPLIQNDLTPELREKYFGRIETSERATYYFKAFESDPVLRMRYADGTDIDYQVYESTKKEAANTFVEMTMQITKEDFREWFNDDEGGGGGINNAKINSISLLTAWYKDDFGDGYRYYQDIQPFTQLNIPNEPLIDLTKGIDITYHIYF